MKLIAGPVPARVTYEVWREFVGREAEDVLIASGMDARHSLAFLRECEADTADLPSLRFYRVRATTTRQTVVEP